MSCFIGITKPIMHREFFIYDSIYKIIEPNTKEEIKESKEIKELKEIKKEPPEKSEKVKQTEKPLQKVEIKNKEKNKSVKTENKKAEKVITPKEIQKKDKPKQEIKKQDTEIKEKVVQNKPDESEEETILWNKWRSDLQNQIMKDVKMPIIQEGIIFKFSFDVDKYGKISNIKTWSVNAMYSPYAIQYIAPVIKSYQGKDILNFPAGSKRYMTSVEGAWKISKNSKYSTPADFKDTEKIIKK